MFSQELHFPFSLISQTNDSKPSPDQPKGEEVTPETVPSQTAEEINNEAIEELIGAQGGNATKEVNVTEDNSSELRRRRLEKFSSQTSDKKQEDMSGLDS